MAAEEGWYTDPYGRHDARLFSAGKPTKLVRDGTIDAYDEPPAEPPASAPMPLMPQNPFDHGEDLRRADEARRGFPPLELSQLSQGRPWRTSQIQRRIG
jgi:hypothetical protein